MIYLDNGPVAKSRVFQNVMHALGIEWMTHIPAGKDGERVTARPKKREARARIAGNRQKGEAAGGTVCR